MLVACGGVDWMELAQRALVSAVMNFWVP